ncbi:MAG TPA: ATP-binding protein [Longimicrobiales bacterium]|nr:ATP-binding protein [Longimicrobiales bacterium]
MMTNGPGRLARFGWLATTAVLAVALVVGSWTNYRGAREAASALNRGQADLLEASIREAFIELATPIDDEVLATMLAAHEQDGLRYIAIFDTAGSVRWSAGTPEFAPEPPREPFFTRGALSPVGDRVRVYMLRPPTRADIVTQDSLRRMAAASGATRTTTTQGGGPGRSGGPGRRWVLMEMEPVLASGIESRAARSLALAIAGATILTLAAMLFWRTSEQYQRALLRIEEQRRLTLLGEMSAVLAHEIRNPLASLKGNAQLLAEKLEAGTREHARAERVIGEATRLEALTSDLLDFARTAPLRQEPVDPVALLQQSTADVAADGFDIDVAGAPSLWPMDATRVRQALVNVLQNARQATSNGRLPQVRVQQDAGRLVYEVRDFGPGLEKGTEGRIFDPFFTTRTTGTGLGLAVAKRVAEAHGGTITAHNHADGGAVFRIELPRTVG